MAESTPSLAAGLVLSCYPEEKQEIVRASRARGFRTPMDLIRFSLRKTQACDGAKIKAPRKIDGPRIS